jgi:hypothetical protein
MQNGSIPPDMFESLMLQALRRSTLLPNTQLIGTMIKLGERRHAWREGIEDDYLQKERTARLERAGYLLVVGADYLIRSAAAIPRHVAWCLSDMATTLRKVGARRHS